MADTRKRNRFKSILEDRDTQITNLKIECDMSRSQHVQATKEEEEDLKQKHMDQVQMWKYGRSRLHRPEEDEAGPVHQ